MKRILLSIMFVSLLFEGCAVQNSDLVQAAKEGDLQTVRKLLSDNRVVDSRDNNGATALIWAASRNHTEIVKLLIEKGAEADAKDSGGKAALLYASHNGYTEVVKLLLDNGAAVNTKNNSGETALWTASFRGHTDVVRLLLENGANAGLIQTETGITPLWIASQEGHIQIVKLLLESGADVNAKRTTDGVSALWMASQQGQFAVVKFLLGKGADVDGKITDGRTALWQASQNGYADIVRVLLKNGAEVNAKETETGITPLWKASSRGLAEIVKLLIASGADVNAKRTTDGVSALWMASEYGYTDVVKLLLDNGADVDAKRPKDDMAALDIALEKGHTEVVGLLQKAKGDFETTREYGKGNRGYDVQVTASCGLTAGGGPMVWRNGQWVPQGDTTVAGAVSLKVNLDGEITTFSTEVTGTRMVNGQAVYQCENGKIFYLDGQNPHPIVPNSFVPNKDELDGLIRQYRIRKTDSLAWDIWNYVGSHPKKDFANESLIQTSEQGNSQPLRSGTLSHGEVKQDNSATNNSKAFFESLVFEDGQAGRFEKAHSELQRLSDELRTQATSADIMIVGRNCAAIGFYSILSQVASDCISNRLSSQNGKQLFTSAQNAASGELDKAAALSIEIVNSEPNYLQAHLLLARIRMGSCMQYNQDCSEVLKLYRDVLKKDETLAVAYMDLGMLYNHMGKIKESIAILETATTQAQGQTATKWAHFMLSLLYSTEKQWRQAKRHAERAQDFGFTGVATNLLDEIQRHIKPYSAAEKKLNSEFRMAAGMGQLERVQNLLKQGADINSGAPSAGSMPAGGTALMLAAAREHSDMVKYLLSQGANVNQSDEGGGTALIYTVWKGYKDIVVILLENGADVSAKTRDGRTPISVARQYGHKEIEKMLKGAN